jgi:uncharacterized membrane protein
MKQDNRTTLTGRPRIPLRTLIFASLSIALVFIVTRFTAIPILQGYFNMGDSVILLASAFFGPWVGMAAGGIGAAMSDFLSPYAIYAPVTLVIKSLEGFVAGYLFGKKFNKYLTVLISMTIMVVGYFFAEALILGLFGSGFGIATALYDLVPNTVQGVVNGAVYILISYLVRIKYYR